MKSWQFYLRVFLNVFFWSFLLFFAVTLNTGCGGRAVASVELPQNAFMCQEVKKPNLDVKNAFVKAYATLYVAYVDCKNRLELVGKSIGGEK